MRLLVIEDEKEIREGLKISLEEQMFAVDTAADGETGSILARTNDYDVIVLDHVLPKKSGAEVCRDVRAKGKTVPIIILSVISTVSHKVSLLECGADDYLTKPFSFEELLARIRAVMRRPASIQPEVLAVADLALDTVQHKVSRGFKDVYLTRKEFELLEYLMRNSGKVLSRGMILEHVWDMNADPFSNTIETHILNLRKKIDSGQYTTKLIHTVPGRGYRLSALK